MSPTPSINAPFKGPTQPGIFCRYSLAYFKGNLFSLQLGYKCNVDIQHSWARSSNTDIRLFFSTTHLIHEVPDKFPRETSRMGVYYWQCHSECACRFLCPTVVKTEERNSHQNIWQASYKQIISFQYYIYFYEQLNRTFPKTKQKNMNIVVELKRNQNS